MKKKNTKLLLMTGVLALLIIAYIVVGKISESERLGLQIDIYSVDKESVTEMEWTFSSKVYTLTKENGIWYWADDKSLSIDQNKAEKMLDEFVNLKASAVFDASEKTDYNLAEDNKRIVKLTDSFGNEYPITIGGYVNTTEEFYILTNDTSKVYTIGNDFVSAFSIKADDIVKS